MVKRSILNDIHVEWVFTVEKAVMEKLQKVNFTINYRFISKNGDSDSNVKRT